MNKSGRRLVFGAIVVILLIVAGVVNVFHYPFTSAKPNFADVERVFNKIQVPADWVEIDSSENRGIAGRACPIESDGCFGIVRVYKVSPGMSDQSVKDVIALSGCNTVSSSSSEPEGGNNYSTFLCSVDAVKVEASLTQKQESSWELGLVVTSD